MRRAAPGANNGDEGGERAGDAGGEGGARRARAARHTDVGADRSYAAQRARQAATLDVLPNISAIQAASRSGGLHAARSGHGGGGGGGGGADAASGTPSLSESARLQTKNYVSSASTAVSGTAADAAVHGDHEHDDHDRDSERRSSGSSDADIYSVKRGRGTTTATNTPTIDDSEWTAHGHSSNRQPHLASPTLSEQSASRRLPSGHDAGSRRFSRAMTLFITPFWEPPLIEDRRTTYWDYFADALRGNDKQAYESSDSEYESDSSSDIENGENERDGRRSGFNDGSSSSSNSDDGGGSAEQRRASSPQSHPRCALRCGRRKTAGRRRGRGRPWSLRACACAAPQRRRRFDLAYNIFNLLSPRAWFAMLSLHTLVGLTAITLLGLALPAYAFLLNDVINSWVDFDANSDQAAARARIRNSIVLFLAVTLCAALLIFLQYTFLGAVARRVRNRLRLWAFAALMQTNGINTERMDRYMHDYDVLGQVLFSCGAAVDHFGLTLLFIAQLTSSFLFGLVLNARFYLVLVASTPLLAVLGLLHRMITDRRSTQLRRASEKAQRYTEMVRAAMPTVVMSNEHQQEFVKMHALMEKERRLQRSVTMMHAGLRSLAFIIVMTMFFCIGVFWGGHLADKTVANTGALVACGVLAFITITSALKVADNANAYMRADERLQLFLEFVLEMVDESQATVGSSLRVDERDVSVVFRNVSYSGTATESSSGARYVLVNLNFRVGHQQTHALVITHAWTEKRLLELLVGSIAPDSGEVLLGKHVLGEYSPATLTATIGMVPPKGRKVLPGATMYENITYGSSGASFTEVRHAAMLVGIHDLIVQMPHGYQTVLHDNYSYYTQGIGAAFGTASGNAGVLLTKAQEQVVALARALLKNPALLLIDTTTYTALMEMTVGGSALDIKPLCEGRTVILVLRARAVEALYFADAISVIDEGRLVESGTHHALMERSGGLYGQIVRANIERDALIDDDEEDEDEDEDGERMDGNARRGRFSGERRESTVTV